MKDLTDQASLMVFDLASTIRQSTLDWKRTLPILTPTLFFKHSIVWIQSGPLLNLTPFLLVRKKTACCARLVSSLE